MSKFTKYVLLVVVLALVAAACGDGNGTTGAASATSSSTTAEPSPATEPTTAAEPEGTTETTPAAPVPSTEAPPVLDPNITATLVIPAGITSETNNLGYFDVNDAFNEIYPNIELVAGGGFWDAADEPAFLAAAANRSVNDVLTGGDEYPDTYGPRGIFLDLRPFLERDAELWFDDERYMNWWLYENPGDNAIYSVAYGGNPMVLWYNPDLLEAAGLEAPPETYDDPAYADWTWDKFREYVVALSEVTDFGVGMENNILLYGPFAATSGGSLINDDATEYLIDSPEVVEALEFLTGFTLDGLAPEPAGAKDLGGINAMFMAGEVGTWFAGAWNTRSYANALEGGEMDFVPAIAAMPHNGVQTGFVSCPSSRVGISAFYDQPEVAYAWLKWLTFDVWDTDIIAPGTPYASSTNIFARGDVWQSVVDAGEAPTSSYGPDGKNLGFLAEDHCGEAMMLQDPPWYGPFLEVRDITLGEIDLVFSGEQSLDEAVAAIKEQADVAILRFNRGN